MVVKYLFQFGFFPWNGYTMLVRNEGKPFFPPRILGLEKTDRYIKYDLIQLLALFFHRSLLLVSPRARALPWASPGWDSPGAGGASGGDGGSGEHPVGVWWLCFGFHPRHPLLVGSWWCNGSRCCGMGGVRCVGMAGASGTPSPP